MVMSKCLPTLRWPMILPTARPISSAPRKGLRSRMMRFLNVLQILLGGIEQFVPLAPAFLGESVVLADDEAFAREQLRAFDLGKIAFVEKRQLQGAVFGGELLYRRGSQRGDPVDSGRLEIVSDARIGDHPAVADHHDTREPEALLELRNLIADCRWIAGVAFEHFNRDWTSIG